MSEKKYHIIKQYKVIYTSNYETIEFSSLKQACRWINIYTNNDYYPWTKHRYWKLTKKLRDVVANNRKYCGGHWSMEEIIL